MYTVDFYLPFLNHMKTIQIFFLLNIMKKVKIDKMRHIFRACLVSHMKIEI